jgi:hypothetical protein
MSASDKPVKSTLLNLSEWSTMSDKERQKFARKILKSLGAEWKATQPASPHEIEDDLLYPNT